MDIKILDNEKSQKTFDVTIPALAIEEFFDSAAQNLSTRFSIKGFREGNAPFYVVAKELGDQKAYKEVIDLALRKFIPEFFVKNDKLNTLGEPEIEVMKIAPKNPFIFKITVAIYPNITIPDLKDIKIKSKKITVSEKDIDNSLEYLKNVRKADKIDDKFAESLGNFKNLSELKKSIKDGIKKDKEQMQKNIDRSKVLEAISKKIKLDIAPILIKRESVAIISQHKEQIISGGVIWDEYLEKIKKTEDELIEEQKKIAKMKIINSIILAKIAKENNIKVEPKEIEEQLKFILDKNGLSTDKIPNDLNIDQIKSNLFQQILNEKIFTIVLDKHII